MEKVEIQEQQVIAWVFVVREDGDDSWKLVELTLSLFGCNGDHRFETKQFHLDEDITGIIPAALETYQTTTGSGRHYAFLGILRPGDGLSDENWLLPYAQDEVSWQGLACRKVTINNQVKTPVQLYQLSKVKN